MSSFVRAFIIASAAVVAVGALAPSTASAQASAGSFNSFTSSLATPTGRTNVTADSVAKINAASTRGLPVPPPPATMIRHDLTWVPDRYVPIPGAAGALVFVPGHWERRLSEREVYVPPLPITQPVAGPQTIPAGVHPPADQRQTP